MSILLPSLTDASLPTTEPFTLRQAADCGATARTLSRLVQRGRLRRMLQGVYVDTRLPESLELRCSALSLVLPPDAFVCDTTAAWLYYGEAALAPNDHLAPPRIQCFRPSGHDRMRNPLTTSGERWVEPTDLREINGLVVTTELRTALDLGRLQRSRPMRLWGMDAMLRTGAFTQHELLANVERFRRQRGVVGLRHLAPLADPGAESFGESSLRLHWYDAGLPRPQLQIPVEVDGVEVARLDMGLPEWLFAAEYDGARWHGKDAAEHDAERREWLRQARGWHIEVFGKEHTFGPKQNADVRLRHSFLVARKSYALRRYGR